jgi:hypothetical protein
MYIQTAIERREGVERVLKTQVGLVFGRKSIERETLEG